MRQSGLDPETLNVNSAYSIIIKIVCICLGFRMLEYSSFIRSIRIQIPVGLLTSTVTSVMMMAIFNHRNIFCYYIKNLGVHIQTFTANLATSSA